ncbi:hypothetical protein BgiMline_025518 [Biomphalaria glabrata]|nr:neuropeptides capa receptor-like [Biomphalaria glabrata]
MEVSTIGSNITSDMNAENSSVIRDTIIVSRFVILFNLYATVLINPLIAIFGLIGNVISIRVLIKSGLEKSSNILLVSLCVADSFCLISAVNIANIISFLPGKRPTDFNMWEYSEQASYVLYILAIIFQICFFFGVPLSATIVTLITMERFVAVFYPLRFTSIVTKNRAWMAVAMSYILWIPYPVYISTFYRFLYREIIAWDLYVGNASFLPNDVIVFIELNLITPLGSYIPFILVTGGSLLIALRVKVTMKKRQTMVSASAKTSAKRSKTTTTLLTVCVVFSVTKFASVMAYVVEYTDQASAEVVNLRLTLGIVTILLDMLNASSNFIIYIVCNKKFRTTVKEMIRHK